MLMSLQRASCPDIFRNLTNSGERQQFVQSPNVLAFRNGNFASASMKRLPVAENWGKSVAPAPTPHAPHDSASGAIGSDPANIRCIRGELGTREFRQVVLQGLQSSGICPLVIENFGQAK